MTQIRRTKIIATLGPATDNPETLQALFKAGADIVRLNFSHGNKEAQARRIASVREISDSLHQEIAILADLQGPKIRIARFAAGSIELNPGDPFVLDAAFDPDAGNEHCVGIDYKDLPNDVSPGNTLMLDDGRLSLIVEEVSGSRIICQVEIGGYLSNNKGINLLGGGLSAKALTEKDKADLAFAVDHGADYIALSFPRNADDVLEAKALIAKHAGQAGVIAKIERIEAVEALEDIIKASDGVMVARGDLGVEIGDAALTAVQKQIIHDARSLDKPVITATQMMESMIHNHTPTRAEVCDVANAVIDGTDAVMLSAETAVGDHPIKVIEAMSRICLGAEKNRVTTVSKHRVECQFERVDEAIAMATMYVANHLDITAIIALTESGSTPLWMSRIRSGIPIYALCRDPATRRRIKLYRGVYPLAFDVTAFKREDINTAAVKVLETHQIVRDDDLVILTKGDLMGVHGGANALKVLRVGRVV